MNISSLVVLGRLTVEGTDLDEALLDTFIFSVLGKRIIDYKNQKIKILLTIYQIFVLMLKVLNLLWYTFCPSTIYS